MNIATQPKAGASSTPAPAPAASQAAEEKGATTEELTTFDVAGALGLDSTGQETDGETEGGDDDQTQHQGADNSQTEGSDTAEGENDEAAGGEASGESGEAGAEGDGTAEAGESDTTEETAAGAEGEKPEDAAGKKHEVFQQRVNELTAGKKTAEAEAARLREQVSTMQAQANGAFNDGPLDAISDLTELDAHDRRAADLHEWALRNPDGGKLPDGKGGETEFSREEVAHINATTHRQLHREIPQRRAWLEQKQLNDVEAVKSYPWLNDTTKGDGKAVQHIVESLPKFRAAMPNYKLVAANAYTGEKLRRAGIVVDDALIARLVKEKQANKPGAKPAGAERRTVTPPRAPAAPGRAAVLPPRRPAGAAEQRAADKRFSQSSGSVDDVAASIAAKLR